MYIEDTINFCKNPHKLSFITNEIGYIFEILFAQFIKFCWCFFVWVICG